MSSSILIVTQHFPPMRTSTAVQMRDLAVDLVSLGHQVFVMTPNSNFGRLVTISHPMPNLMVISVGHLGADQKIYFIRFLSELSLSISFFVAFLTSPLKSVRVQYIVSWSPTIFLGPFIYLLKAITHAKSYLILRDIFPDWMVDVGLLRKGVLFKFLSIFSDFQYLTADIIGVQSPSNIASVINKPGCSNDKLEVLYNWLTPVGTQDIGSLPYDIKDFLLKFCEYTICVYAGNLGISQDPTFLVKLAQSISDQKEIIFLIIGSGTEKESLLAMVRTLNISNTFIFDTVSETQLSYILKKCSIGLISLSNLHTSHNIPGKLLSYLNSSLPVVGRANTPSDLASIVNSSGSGFISSSDDMSPYKDYILSLHCSPYIYNSTSSSAFKTSRAFFNTRTASSQILQSLESLS